MTLELRKQYFKEINKKIKNKTEDYKECQSILDNIYSKECNIENRGQEKYKFYVYKNLNNWDDARYKSEIKDIKNNEITMVSPALFNDPYDTYLTDPIIDHLLEMFNYTPTKIGENKQRYKKEISSWNWNKKREESNKIIRNNNRIYCLATRYDSMYFWSHYGGNHKGYCLEYEIEKDKLITQDLSIMPAAYINNQIELIQKKYNEIIQTMLVCAKSTDWEMEQEWRAVYNNKSSEQICKKYFPYLSGVYFGIDFEEKDDEDKINSRKDELKSIIKEWQITAYQMKMSDTEFKLEAEKIIDAQSLKNKIAIG